MKHLEAIIAANNSADTLCPTNQPGDKLGRWNGQPVLKAVHATEFWAVRADIRASRRPLDPPFIDDNSWENSEYADYMAFRDRLLDDAANVQPEGHFPILEKEVL